MASHRVARFDLGPVAAGDGVTRVAPATAVYKVKFADGADELRSHGGTRRVVRRGEPLGFATSPEGQVLAVAGAERIPLDRLPESARFCVWQHKVERPTQFTKEVGKAVGTTGAVLGTAALVTGVVAVHVAAEVVEDAVSDDDDDDESEGRPNRRDRDRGYWIRTGPARGNGSPRK
jgi:hypothetical protein